jgi:hypothetical protein
MAAPFVEASVPEQDFFGRLFGRPDRRGFATSIHNLLAAANDWNTLARDDIDAIEQHYGLTLASSQPEAAEIMQQAAQSLSAQQVVEGGVARLQALAAVLGCVDVAAPVVAARARAALDHAADIVLDDADVSSGDRRDFDAAAQSAGFSKEEADAILTDGVVRRMKDEIARVLADGKFDAAEEERLGTMADMLGVKLQLDDATKDALQRARRLWEIEDGPLTPVPSPVDLPSTEECYFAARGQVQEQRSRGNQTATYSYGRGTIVLTTKRIISTGGEKDFAIRLNTIAAHSEFEDGVEVRRGTGKPLTFALDAKDPSFGQLFKRLIRAQG